MGCETVRTSAQVIPVRKSVPSRLEVFVGFRITSSFRYQWSSPGGNIDFGETPEAAAIRELREETGAVADQNALELLRNTIPITRDRIYRVSSFLLDATNLDLKNTSHGEHSTMMWRDIGQLMREHRARVAQNIIPGTVPTKLAETFTLLEQNQAEPLESLAEKVKIGYAKLKFLDE